MADPKTGLIHGSPAVPDEGVASDPDVFCERTLQPEKLGFHHDPSMTGTLDPVLLHEDVMGFQENSADMAVMQVIVPDDRPPAGTIRAGDNLVGLPTRLPLHHHAGHLAAGQIADPQPLFGEQSGGQRLHLSQKLRIVDRFGGLDGDIAGLGRGLGIADLHPGSRPEDFPKRGDHDGFLRGDRPKNHTEKSVDVDEVVPGVGELAPLDPRPLLHQVGMKTVRAGGHQAVGSGPAREAALQVLVPARTQGFMKGKGGGRMVRHLLQRDPLAAAQLHVGTAPVHDEEGHPIAHLHRAAGQRVGEDPGRGEPGDFQTPVAQIFQGLCLVIEHRQLPPTFTVKKEDSAGLGQPFSFRHRIPSINSEHDGLCLAIDRLDHPLRPGQGVGIDRQPAKLHPAALFQHHAPVGAKPKSRPGGLDLHILRLLNQNAGPSVKAIVTGRNGDDFLAVGELLSQGNQQAPRRRPLEILVLVRKNRSAPLPPARGGRRLRPGREHRGKKAQENGQSGKQNPSHGQFPGKRAIRLSARIW